MSVAFYEFLQEDSETHPSFQTDEASVGDGISFFWQRVQVPQYQMVATVPSDVRESGLSLSEAMAHIQAESLQFLDRF